MIMSNKVPQKDKVFAGNYLLILYAKLLFQCVGITAQSFTKF